VSEILAGVVGRAELAIVALVRACADDGTVPTFRELAEAALNGADWPVDQIPVSRDWLVEVDSTTSWVAHRINRQVLGDENRDRLLAISGVARAAYEGKS
jgi:hypothetical protein